MNEIAFLSGKVLKRSLPVVQNPADAGALATKRLLLPQGELTQFYDADDPVHYIALLELRAGSTRGNHYHKVKEEWLYVIRGELDLLVGDVHSNARATVPLAAGDVVILNPGIAHALRTVMPGHCIEFSKCRFDPADTFRFPLDGAV